MVNRTTYLYWPPTRCPLIFGSRNIKWLCTLGRTSRHLKKYGQSYLVLNTQSDSYARSEDTCTWDATKVLRIYTLLTPWVWYYSNGWSFEVLLLDCHISRQLICHDRHHSVRESRNGSPSRPISGQESSAPEPISPSVTYILPLIHSASGNAANPQRPVVDQFRNMNDHSAVILLLTLTSSYGWCLSGPSCCPCNFGDLDPCVTVPFWLCLPGVLLFAAGLECCVSGVMRMSWITNGFGARKGTVRPSSLIGGWVLEPGTEDERW